MEKSWNNFLLCVNQLGKPAKPILFECGLNGESCKNWGKGVLPSPEIQNKLVKAINKDVPVDKQIKGSDIFENFKELDIADTPEASETFTAMSEPVKEDNSVKAAKPVTGNKKPAKPVLVSNPLEPSTGSGSEQGVAMDTVVAFEDIESDTDTTNERKDTAMTPKNAPVHNEPVVKPTRRKAATKKAEVNVAALVDSLKDGLNKLQEAFPVYTDRQKELIELSEKLKDADLDMLIEMAKRFAK